MGEDWLMFTCILGSGLLITVIAIFCIVGYLRRKGPPLPNPFKCLFSCMKKAPAQDQQIYHSGLFINRRRELGRPEVRPSYITNNRAYPSSMFNQVRVITCRESNAMQVFGSRRNFPRQIQDSGIPVSPPSYESIYPSTSMSTSDESGL